MSKATKFTFLLSVWVIILFSVAMALTFFSDWLQMIGFFGDTRLDEFDDWAAIDGWYNWGKRHYWYFWLCVILFFISVARIIIWAIEYWRTSKE